MISKKYNIIAEKVLENLTEGIIAVYSDGTIIYANEAARNILCLPKDGVIGQKFGALFFENAENDAFCQTVIDALHSEEKIIDSIVPFSANGKTRHLRMYVAYLPDATDISNGYIIAFTDLSELIELRDIAQGIERISKLNRQLTLRNELLQKTFGMFLSDEVVQELLDKPGGLNLGGRSEVLTIMMSDLRGFTALSEQMEPDNLIRMLNHYLAEMTKEIQKCSGTIIEFIGDGIMAIFGAPIHSRTHAADAVAAAIGMQAAMKRVNAWNEKMGFPHLEMGIGLNTGEVIVGNVGSRKRMKYGVVGSHVNLCGRIESYTVGGQILISPSVKDAVASPLTIEKELDVAPKGVGRNMILSQVTGIGEPYNASIDIEKDTLEKLSEPVPVSFSLVRDKHAESVKHYGGLTSLGRESAILQTDTDLKIYDNLKISAGGPLLAKIRDEVERDSYLIQFTSVPSGFGAWKDAMVSFSR